MARIQAALLATAVLAIPAALPAITSASASQQAAKGVQLWTLSFMPGELKSYVHPATGNAYWYFTYVVVNNTGSEKMWAPTIELFDGKGNLMPTGREVPSDVHRAIKQSFKDGAVEDQFEVLGKLPIGPENGKEGLCVWKAAKLDSTDLAIFVRGLSNETKRVQETPDAQPSTLRRTMRLDYKVGADERATGSDVIPQTGSEWIFR